MTERDSSSRFELAVHLATLDPAEAALLDLLGASEPKEYSESTQLVAYVLLKLTREDLCITEKGIQRLLPGFVQAGFFKAEGQEVVAEGSVNGEKVYAFGNTEDMSWKYVASMRELNFLAVLMNSFAANSKDIHDFLVLTLLGARGIRDTLGVQVVQQGERTYLRVSQTSLILVLNSVQKVFDELLAGIAPFERMQSVGKSIDADLAVIAANSRLRVEDFPKEVSLRKLLSNYRSLREKHDTFLTSILEHDDDVDIRVHGVHSLTAVQQWVFPEERRLLSSLPAKADFARIKAAEQKERERERRKQEQQRVLQLGADPTRNQPKIELPAPALQKSAKKRERKQHPTEQLLHELRLLAAVVLRTPHAVSPELLAAVSEALVELSYSDRAHVELGSATPQAAISATEEKVREIFGSEPSADEVITTFAHQETVALLILALPLFAE